MLLNHFSTALASVPISVSGLFESVGFVISDSFCVADDMSVAVSSVETEVYEVSTVVGGSVESVAVSGSRTSCRLKKRTYL